MQQQQAPGPLGQPPLQQPPPAYQPQQQQPMMGAPGQYRPPQMMGPPPPNMGAPPGPPMTQPMVPNGSVPSMPMGQQPPAYGDYNHHGGPMQQPPMRPPGPPGPPGMQPYPQPGGPMPGQMQPGQMPPGQMQPGQMPGQFDQQQQQRMDLDQIPNPIEVALANAQKMGGEVFETNEAGKIPPLVTTDFVCKDAGNCNPRFMRSTIYSVPNNPDLLKQSKLPFVIALTPFAELKNGEVFIA